MRATRRSLEHLEAMLGVLIDRSANPMSILTSPTPPTTPTLPLDVLETMMSTMTTMFSNERRETREMVLDILQGRAGVTTGQTVIEPIESAPLTNYDDDPLPPEIEAVLARETSETLELQALLRERETLQARAMVVEQEMRTLHSSEDSFQPLSENETYPSTDD